MFHMKLMTTVDSVDNTMITHSQLVALASKWLAKHERCAVVITEMATQGSETPDAIGWRGTRSTVIECKVSRSDFEADQKKVFRRQPELGIGVLRYYLTTSGLLSVGELPDGWGLLEPTAYGIRVVKPSFYFKTINGRHEIGILLSALRRVGHNAPKSCSIRCYTIETGNTASLGLLAMADGAADADCGSTQASDVCTLK
jgi:hypothetical protein